MAKNLSALTVVLMLLALAVAVAAPAQELKKRVKLADDSSPVERINGSGPPPNLTSFSLLSLNPSNSTSALMSLGFDLNVTNVDATDLLWVENGASLTTVTVSGSGSSYTVSVDGISGDGTLEFNLNPSNNIRGPFNQPLATAVGGPTIIVDMTKPETMLISPTMEVIQYDDATFDFVASVSDSGGAGFEEFGLFASRDPLADTSTYSFVDFSTTDTIEFNIFTPNVIPSGNGTWAFYTIGLDAAGNFEDPPAVPDQVVDLYYLSTQRNLLYSTNLLDTEGGQGPGRKSKDKTRGIMPSFPEPTLYTIDPNSGATVAKVEMRLQGFFGTLFGCVALDQNPIDGKLYGIFRSDGKGVFDSVGTVDPNSGAVTIIDEFLPGDFDTAAFTPDGRFLAIVNNDSFNSNELWQIDISGNDNHMEIFQTSQAPILPGTHSIDFLTSGSLLIHLFGANDLIIRGDDRRINLIDPDGAFESDERLLTGDPFAEASAIAGLNDFFHIATRDEELFTLDQFGNATYIGEMDHQSEAMAWAGNPDVCPIYTGNYLIDDTLGNRNGVADPGEEISVFLELENKFGLTQGNVFAAVSDCTTSPVMITSGTIQWPDIVPLDSQYNLNPITIEIPFDQPCTLLCLTLTVTTDQGNDCSVLVRIPMGMEGTMPIAYEEDFEGDFSEWTFSGNWRSQANSICLSPLDGFNSPSTAAVFNLGEGNCGNYGDNRNDSLTLNQDIVITDGAQPPTLEFWHHFEAEGFFDPGFVEISTNGGSNWDVLRVFDTEDLVVFRRGTEPFFRGIESISLQDYVGQAIRIRFRMTTDFTVQDYPGWYIDDVKILNNDRICDPYTPPPPCPTGTPIPTPSVTPTPTPTGTQPPTLTPTATPPVSAPAIFSTVASNGQITASHSGIVNGGLRHFVAFWARNANSQSNRWSYLGFVEYSSGEQSTSIPWIMPSTDTRYEVASRLFIEGTGFSGPYVFGVLSDLPSQYPVVDTVSYDEATSEVVVSFSQIGGLASNVGFWTRRIQPMPLASAEALEPWVYHGVAPYELNTTELRIPFDNGGNVYEFAVAVYAQNFGFDLPYGFQFSPDTEDVYMNLARLEPGINHVEVSFSPVGNLPVKAALWFREVGGRGCLPVCGWTLMGVFDPELLTREQTFPWFPLNAAGDHEIVMRLYIDDGFGGLTAIGEYVYWSPCGTIPDLPSVPTPTPTASPIPTATPTATSTPIPSPTATPTPTTTPSATVTPTTTIVVVNRPLDERIREEREANVGGHTTTEE